MNAPVFKKTDAGKNRLGLLPPHATEAVGRVLTFGAAKYEPGNWRRVDDRTRYMDAALRHVLAYQRGEHADAESGEHHLAHAVCCLMFIVELEAEDALALPPLPPAGDVAAVPAAPPLRCAVCSLLLNAVGCEPGNCRTVGHHVGSELDAALCAARARVREAVARSAPCIRGGHAVVLRHDNALVCMRCNLVLDHGTNGTADAP